MEDLQSTLQSILSDPAQMARVAALAESLGLKPPDAGADGSAESSRNRPPEAAGEETRSTKSEPFIETTGAFGQAEQSGETAFRRGEEAVRSAAPSFAPAGIDLGSLMSRLSALNGAEDRVLNALRPVLSPEGQGRVDRALRAAKLSRLAGRFLEVGSARRV